MAIQKNSGCFWVVLLLFDILFGPPLLEAASEQRFVPNHLEVIYELYCQIRTTPASRHWDKTEMSS